MSMPSPLTIPSVAWRNYADHYSAENTVVGTLKVAADIWSPQLRNARDIIVYLPPSYHKLTDRRYPVLYMQDGQNLFDAHTSFSGEWRVDETLQSLSHEGHEAIVVGIPNAGEMRLQGYSPFVDPRHGGGQGDSYLSFLVDTLKPLIDQDFRTKPDRLNSGLIGSSMGGLISLYGFFSRWETFGLAGVMSPSLWFANRAILSYLADQPYRYGRIYLDAGTREYGRHGLRNRLQSRAYYGGVRKLYRNLYHAGYQPLRTVRYVEDRWAEHNELAWASRLPAALRWLLTR